MIYKITINDTSKSNFSYVSCKNNKTDFKFPSHFTFSKGKNILIGENGCGKTTIINIIADYMFCKKDEFSNLNQNSVQHFFSTDNNKFGIDIKANYDICTFKTYHEEEKNNSDILNDHNSFFNHLNRVNISSGQKTIDTMYSLFETMFCGEHNKFDKIYLNSNVNDLWENRFLLLKKYFTDNHIEEKDQIFTVLLDEPDRNLSLSNIQQLYTVLSTPKDNEQMICAIHNPMLIYKLSKLEHINFIELTEDYLDKIIEFVEK
jgi:predicted ATPase